MGKKCIVSREELDVVVDELMQSYADQPETTNLEGYELPSKQEVNELTFDLESILFPGYVSREAFDPFTLRYAVGKKLSDIFSVLMSEIEKCLYYAKFCQTSRCVPPPGDRPIAAIAQCKTLKFFQRLPAIRKSLFDDVRAAYLGDPAAKSYGEIILSYPGFQALTIYRLAHELHLLQTPILPRMMSEIVHTRTGIDIHPGAQIGKGLFIDHGTGVVIGETTIIGDNVKIYQGVTLGALSIPAPEHRVMCIEQRHPTIEDRVTIYAGATILGGKTVIGHDSIVGSNAWLTHSVKAGTKVLFQPPENRFKDRSQQMPAITRDD